MSGSETTSAPGVEDFRSGRVEEYDEMLEALDGSIDEMRRKIENGRIRDVENERVRIKRQRALAYALNVRRQIINDSKRSELEQRIDRLEDLQGGE